MEDKNSRLNTFEINNFYVDDCLPLLTGEETKILFYAIRKILGWKKETDNISLTQFIAGTGLNKATILKSLKSLDFYGLLVQLSISNNNPTKGSEYFLQLDITKVNISGLKERASKKQAQSNRSSNLHKTSDNSTDAGLSGVLVYGVNQFKPCTSLSGKPVEKNSIENKGLTDTGLSSVLVYGVNTQNSLKKEEKEKREETPSLLKTSGFEEEPKNLHPVIVAIKEITGRYPEEVLWDRIIKLTGDSPNLDKLKECAVTWSANGYNLQNVKGWLFDWYVKGIPEKKKLVLQKQEIKPVNQQTKTPNIAKPLVEGPPPAGWLDNIGKNSTSKEPKSISPEDKAAIEKAQKDLEFFRLKCTSPIQLQPEHSFNC